MAILTDNNLALERCPHCGVHKPNLTNVTQAETHSHSGQDTMIWRCFVCGSCGKLVSAFWYKQRPNEIIDWFPKAESVDGDLGGNAGEFLRQAIECRHAPAGAIMLAASCIDAMLKDRDYKDGNLFGRIDQAAKDGVITEDMKQWAHEVRLEANNQRHADQNAGLPTVEDADRVLGFAKALAEYLVVLPARVRKGRQKG